MSDVSVEVAVVGAGLMGAATAWELTRRGHSVALIEAFEPGHTNGSSHGSSRIVRRVYDDPFYISLTGRAFELWEEAESDAGVRLIRTTGGIDHGTDRDPAVLAPLLAAAGVPHQVLRAYEAEARWPGMRFDGDVLFHPQAGVLDADAAVKAWVRLVGERDGVVMTRTRVESVKGVPGGVLVHTDRQAVRADTVVVAAGPWLPEFADNVGVANMLPKLTVTQQQVFHFPHRDPAAAWPTFVLKGPFQAYGLSSGSDGGPRPAYKVAQHDGGKPTTASTRDGVIDQDSRDRVIRYVTEWLPGLDPHPVAEASCLYTRTPNEDFVLDRVGPVVVVSPCSGHGAKFAPLVGAAAADLAEGRPPAYPRFTLR